MPIENRPLRVFLCHAHSDADAVRTLYRQLKREGIDAWLDNENLLPGVDWELEIRKAVHDSDIVIVCLSKQFDKAGFRQKEVKIALDAAMEQPEGEVFIIPARLEECETPESLKRWQWVDLFEEDGTKKLIRALNIRAERIGATLRIHRENQPVAPPLKMDKPEKPGETATSSPDLPSSIPFSPLRSVFQQTIPLLKVAIVIVIALFVIWIGSWAMGLNFSSIPTPVVRTPTILSSTTATQSAILMVTDIVSYSLTAPSSSSIPALTPGGNIQHQVVAGESLSQIASCYGANFDEVNNANPEIKDPDKLTPGTTIVVPHIGSTGKIYGPPCFVYYTVQSGDTWNSIALKYNADLKILKALNLGGLSVGQVLFIPRFQGSFPLIIHQSPNQDSNQVPTPPKNIVTLTPGGSSLSPVSANKGQTMNVKFTGADSVTLGILDPAGSTIKPIDNIFDWNGIIPEDGEYQIILINRSNSLIECALEVSLTTVLPISSATFTP